MILQGQVGPVVLQDGTYPNIRQGKQGDIIVSELHGRYYEAGSRGNSFIACTQAAVTLSAGLSATCVFGLRNPAGSGKNLIINQVNATLTALPAAITVLLHSVQNNTQAAAPTAVTQLTVQAALVGSTSPAVGIPFSAATLAAAPVAVRVGISCTNSSPASLTYMSDELAGAIVLTPGSIYTLQATVACSLICSIGWEEVPI